MRTFAAISVLILALGAACASGVPKNPPSGPASVAPPVPGGGPAAPVAVPGQPPAGGSSGPASRPDTTVQAPAAQALPPLDHMIIRNVTLSMTVGKVADAYRQVERVVADLGGYVSGSQFKQDGDRTSATITVRVPADSRTYADAMERFRGLAESVVEEQGSTQEVTEEWVDLESRLRSLRATETRIQALYEKAQRLDEIYSVQRELTSVRSQIEQIEGRKRALESRSAMATITLQLREPVAPPPPPPSAPEWSPATVATEAAGDLAKVLRGLGTLAIWLLVWLPLYGLPLLALWLLRRRLRALLNA
jgi:hypothetical protein